MIAFAIANSLILQVDRSGTTARTIDPISPDVAEPDQTVFNERAISPTVKTVTVTISNRSDAVAPDMTDDAGALAQVAAEEGLVTQADIDATKESAEKANKPLLSALVTLASSMMNC